MSESNAGNVGASCVVVVNPTAGMVTEALVAEVVELSARYLSPVRTVWTRHRGDASELVRAELSGPPADAFRVIVSVGGDGTVLEVVEGMLAAGPPASRTALFVVPAGTGNSNYRSHWDERPWQESLRTALREPTAMLRMLDLARIAELDAPVVLGAGAGLTAKVLEFATSTPLRGRARLQAGLEQAAARFTPFAGRVLVDGKAVHDGKIVLVSIGGGRHRAWQYEVLPESLLDDGLLDVCVVGAEVDPRSVPRLLRTGRHIHEPGVVYQRGRQVIVDSAGGSPLCFEHDGELVTTPSARFTVDVVPGVLPVLCAPGPTPAREA